MTVLEHLMVAARARRGDGRLWKDVVGLDRPRAEDREEADRTLELLGLTDVVDQPVESLSLGRGRLVEVGRALMTEPTLLLLDEPSSGLDRNETAELTETLEAVQRERSAAVLLVEHDVEMVQRFATRLYVLDFGTLIAEGPTGSVMSDPTVRRAYLGEVGPDDTIDVSPNGSSA
jgi:branched-chain amino acid transport system ATP-binding protein